MARIVLPILIALTAMMSVSEAADSPVDTVSQFYGSYLAYDDSNASNIPRPQMDLSTSFSAVVSNTAAVCEKYADYPCGWGAEGDEYLDAQESDPDLTYENSGIVLTEILPGVVEVQLNVYPSVKDAGDYYLRTITFKMVMESGKWVVDDVMYADGWSTKLRLTEQAREAEQLYMKEHPTQQQ